MTSLWLFTAGLLAAGALLLVLAARLGRRDRKPTVAQQQLGQLIEFPRREDRVPFTPSPRRSTPP